MSCVWRWERPTNLPSQCLLSNFAGGSRGCSPPERDGTLSLVVTLLPAQGSARTSEWGYLAFRHKVSPSGRWQGARSPPAPSTPQTTGCPAPPGISRVGPAARSQAPSTSPPAQGCPGWPASLNGGTSTGSFPPRRAGIQTPVPTRGVSSCPAAPRTPRGSSRRA